MNKTNELNSIITRYQPDILFFCETWFTPDAPLIIENFQAPFHLSRVSARGGVAIYIRDNLSAFKLPGTDMTTSGSEQVWCGLNIGQEHILLGCIYRPPSADITVNSIINKSIQRAATLVEQGKFTRLLLVGDFNHHIVWSSIGGTANVTNAEDSEFLDTINTCLLTQFVNEPTFGNNQLDLVLADDPNAVFNISVGPPLGFTEKGHFHATLSWDLQLIHPTSEPT